MSTAELDTKQNWDDCHFDQHPTHSIHLSGQTVICGQLKICSPTGFTASYGAGQGKAWLSDASGIGTWQDAKSLSITKLISQATHGFAVNDVIGWNALGCYTKAIANGTYNGEVLGVVSKVYNATCFDLTQGGYISGLTGLIASCTYFLSDVTPGLLTTTEISTPGHIDKSVLIATTPTTGWILPYPGYYIASGGTSGGGTLTGATNGVCKYNSANVCLGGTLSSSVVICTSGVVNGLNLCAVNGACCNLTQMLGGTFSSYGCDAGLGWRSCISVGSNTQISAYSATANNVMQFRPDAVYFTIGGTGSGILYSGDYCTKFNSNCRSIPDVDWIKRYALGGWTNLTNGSTVAGCGTVISASTICQNTLYGVNAGKSITTGQSNVAVGFNALCLNVSGFGNIAIGTNALPKNTVDCNVAIGYATLANNTTGTNNIAIGYQTLTTNIGGSANIGLGQCALGFNTSGADNIAVGYRALFNNAGGTRNVGVGSLTLLNNISGNDNTAIGTNALCVNTSSSNVAIGSNSLWKSVGAYDNTAVGVQALGSFVTGGFNVGIGENTLYSNTAGNQNTALGTHAGYYSTGSRNVFLGYDAGSIETTGSDKLHIANNGTCTLICGDFAGKTVTIDGTITATNFILSSDCRLKTCIEPISISPVNVEYKQFELISEPNQIRYGVLAQDLQKVNPELVRVGADGMLSIAQMDLVFKELAYLKNKVNELENRLG